MKKRTRRLNLNRETLVHLNPGKIQPAGGKDARDIIIRESQEPACYSPFCGPTFWKGCDTVQTA